MRTDFEKKSQLVSKLSSSFEINEDEASVGSGPISSGNQNHYCGSGYLRTSDNGDKHQSEACAGNDGSFRHVHDFSSSGVNGFC